MPHASLLFPCVTPFEIATKISRYKPGRGSAVTYLAAGLGWVAGLQQQRLNL